MENTLENKAKFFALYWQQAIVFNEKESKEYCPVQSFPLETNRILINSFLKLTPLIQITDEHALHIAKIKGVHPWLNEQGAINAIKRFLLQIENGEQYFMEGFAFLELIDFLRSKGYALPWMGLSVEQLVSFGWVKLKEV